jgi:hypothetical protein
MLQIQSQDTYGARGDSQEDITVVSIPMYRLRAHRKPPKLLSEVKRHLIKGGIRHCKIYKIKF